MVKILSHAEMAPPFIGKAQCIQQSLTILHKEKLPKKFSDEIASILEKYEKFCSTAIPYIEKKTSHKFLNQEFFFIVIFYKEISKVFNEMNQQVDNGSLLVPISPDIFAEMKKLRETLLALAFIGDSAIELGVLPILWPRKKIGEIPEKGVLDSAKKIFTTRENQAKLWDYLVPGDRDSSQKYTDTKSAKFEAVFGIIYLEGGLENVEKAIRILNENIPQ